MKTINFKPTVLAVVMLFMVDAVLAQGASGLLQTAETEISNSTGTLKNIFGMIFLVIAGGAIIYAAYTAFFDQQQMRRAMIGLIVGVLFGSIGAAMSLIN